MTVQDIAHRRTLTEVNPSHRHDSDPDGRDLHHEGDGHGLAEVHDHHFEWPAAARIAVVAIAAAAVWFRALESFPAISVFVGVAALLVGGWPILKEAIESIAERRMTMELSMVVAIV